MVALDSFYPMTGVTEQLAQWQKFAPNYFSDGVVATLSNFLVAQHAPAGMNVDVPTGQCFIQGVFGENGSTKTLTIAAADATNPRIDRVVLRCDTVAQDLEVLVITGTAAASPTAPSLVRSTTQTDYSLAQVLVGTTVTSVLTANITDERVFCSPRGLPFIRSFTAAGTIQPLGILPLTESWQAISITGTTTIASIATGNTPPRAGQMLLMEFGSAGGLVNATGGNMKMSRPFTSGVAAASLVLFWDGSGWVDLSRSGEQAPAHQYYGNNTGSAAAATFSSIVAADLPANTTWTITSIVQGTAVSFTANLVRVVQFGKFASVNAQVTFTTAGTIGSIITVTLPASLTMASATANVAVGVFSYFDSGTAFYAGTAMTAGATSINFVCHNQGAQLGNGPSFGIANNDYLTFMLNLELA